MLNLSHIMRSGKYAGKTIKYVYQKDRRYFNWVAENRPQMLKSHKSKSTSIQSTKLKNVDQHNFPRGGAFDGIKPNETFYQD